MAAAQPPYSRRFHGSTSSLYGPVCGLGCHRAGGHFCTLGRKRAGTRQRAAHHRWLPAGRRDRSCRPHCGRQAAGQPGAIGDCGKQSGRRRPRGGPVCQKCHGHAAHADAGQPSGNGGSSLGGERPGVRRRQRLCAGERGQQLCVWRGGIQRRAGQRNAAPVGLAEGQPGQGQYWRARHRQPAALFCADAGPASRCATRVRPRC